MRFLLIAYLFILGLVHSAEAADFKIDPSLSQIAFSGTNSGSPFKGTFDKWDAVIHFDPNNLGGSKISVTIDMASATTGDAMYDGTLPNADWFDVKNHPKAEFATQEITKNGDGSFTAKGLLIIREKSVPIQFTFNLVPADLSSSPVKTNFSLTLDRLAYGIGEKSDPKAEWVSREIKLDVTVSANRL